MGRRRLASVPASVPRTRAEHRRRVAAHSRAEQQRSIDGGRRCAPAWSSVDGATRGGGVGEGRRVGQERAGGAVRVRRRGSAWVAAGAGEGARVRDEGEGLGLGVLIQRL